MNEFDDIRPYQDDEVRPVVQELIQDPELARAMAKFKFPVLYKLLPGLMVWVMQVFLKRELQSVSTIHDVQIVIEKYLDRLIETTTAGLTQSGLEQLDPGKPYLFISNHRDITMDPALVNYMLYHHNFDTLQIAIGDNLLKRPFLSHLMKLNKSFIVKRSVQGREKLAASKQLSAYIHHCIDTGQNVWIAQREGRAKDGIDKTESAVIKMLHLANRDKARKLSIQDSMNSLNIVPVAISYEFDPCDQAKARELFAIDTEGKYVKDENADVQSILSGIVGQKGAVHVSFGECITLDDLVTEEGVAELIDQQIISSYKLHLVNHLALEKIQPGTLDKEQLQKDLGLSELELAKKIKEKQNQLERRLVDLPDNLHSYVLNMYANPVIRKIEY